MPGTRTYGPFWHYTSSKAVAEIMATGWLQGRSPKLGGVRGPIPKVKAWTRRLHANAEPVVCFRTEVRPDRDTPPQFAFWSEGEPGVVSVIAGELVEIPITIEPDEPR